MGMRGCGVISSVRGACGLRLGRGGVSLDLDLNLSFCGVHGFVVVRILRI